jgi:hypothetical protein
MVFHDLPILYSGVPHMCHMTQEIDEQQLEAFCRRLI